MLKVVKLICHIPQWHMQQKCLLTKGNVEVQGTLQPSNVRVCIGDA